MNANYDFVGGPYDGQRKSLDTSEMPLATQGGTYRPSGTGHSVQGGPTIYTAVWAQCDAPHGVPIAVGDPFPLDENNVGDCSAMQIDGSGVFTAACVLDEDHPGHHVASNGETVVEVWS